MGAGRVCTGVLYGFNMGYGFRKPGRSLVFKNFWELGVVALFRASGLEPLALEFKVQVNT